MITQVHKHIINELQQNIRTDRIFVITAIVFNLIALAINASIAGSHDSATDDLIMGIFIFISIVINTIAALGLNTGRKSREKLLHGLISMYEDHDVAKYYDISLVKGYKNRYFLFIAVILSLAFTAIVIPLIIRFSHTPM